MYIDQAVSKQGEKIYIRTLLRTSYREGGKVKHKTIANLSKCSSEEIEALKLAFKHKKDLTELCSIKDDIKTKMGLSVGAIYLLNTIADRLHITKAFGNTRQGKLALWQVMARIINQGSRLSAVRLAEKHAICDLIGLDAFNEDDLYENLNWISRNQEEIEETLFKGRFKTEKEANLYLYDVTSSYVEGEDNETKEYGYNQDSKKGKEQIVVWFLTDEEGIPVAVEVFKGNTSDPQTFLNQINKIVNRFGVKHVTMVADKGMIKSGQINELDEVQYHYITSITKSKIGQAFRMMKNEVFEVMPIYEMNEDSIKAHVFVVMLAYIIIKELKRLWAKIDVEIKEAIEELSTITLNEIKVGKISYQQIPEPRELGAKLLETAGVKLPKALLNQNVVVTTRKKIVNRRRCR